MYGMIFSIKSFAQRLSPTDMKEGFLNFSTSKYKLHFFETHSGLKFIMNTDLHCGGMKDVLHQIFSSLYVEYVVKNPLCELDKPVTSELFKVKLDEYIKSLPQFAIKPVSWPPHMWILDFDSYILFCKFVKETFYMDYHRSIDEFFTGGMFRKWVIINIYEDLIFPAWLFTDYMLMLFSLKRYLHVIN